MSKDRLIRGTSKCARFFVCETTNLVKEAQKLHNLDPIATMNFGKLLTGAAIIGKDLKGNRDIVTLKVNGTGPYGTMVATANKHGEIKGYISDPTPKLHQIIDENGNFIADESGRIRFIGEGTFQIIKDLGLRDPFSGVSMIKDEEMSDILANYLLISDQIKSVVALGVKMDENGEVIKAGGYMVQLLPGVEEGFIDKLENKLKQIRGITDLLKGGFSLERIAELLYEDITVVEEDAEMEGAHKKTYVEEYEILENAPLEYKCNCSKEKYFNGVLTLGEKEINEILENDGKIEVQCHFCNKKYDFVKKDFEGVNFNRWKF